MPYLSQLGSKKGKHSQVVHSKSTSIILTKKNKQFDHHLLRHRNNRIHPRHLKQPLWDAGCITQRGPRATRNSLPRSGRNLRAIPKVQLLQGRVPQDFQQVCGPVGTFGVRREAPGMLKRDQKGTVGIKGRQCVAAPLASDFCKSDNLQLSISHFGPFNVAKCCQRNSRPNGLNIPKKTRRLTNWPNIATKFARRGTL